MGVGSVAGARSPEGRRAPRLQLAPALRLRGGEPRARPHCRVRHRWTDYLSSCGVKRMSNGATRECERPNPRGAWRMCGGGSPRSSGCRSTSSRGGQRAGWPMSCPRNRRLGNRGQPRRRDQAWEASRPPAQAAHLRAGRARAGPPRRRPRLRRARERGGAGLAEGGRVILLRRFVSV